MIRQLTQKNVEKIFVNTDRIIAITKTGDDWNVFIDVANTTVNKAITVAEKDLKPLLIELKAVSGEVNLSF